MDFSEKWGTTVEEAVSLALADLNLSQNEVDIKVIEEPSKGFFGIGSKLALVRVEKKKAVSVKDDSFVKQERKREIGNEVAEIKETAVKETEPAAKNDFRKEKEGEGRSLKKDGDRERRNKPKRADRPERFERSERTDRFPKDGKFVETYGEDLSDGKEFVFTGESVTAERPADLVDCPDHPAVKFLLEMTEKMGLTVEVTAMKNDSTLYLDINGKDSGTVIGKRGQTLDAIQYLTSLVVNKEKEGYVRVVVDAEGYRMKRERTLEGLAMRLADKVIKSRRSVRLEPMNPYERKVIHATLQGNNAVSTRSEGEEPYRRVVIDLKR